MAINPRGLQFDTEMLQLLHVQSPEYRQDVMNLIDRSRDTEYVLATDGDGHWYVVAVGDFEAFIERCEDPYSDFDGLEVEEVGGSPMSVVFTGYRIE